MTKASAALAAFILASAAASARSQSVPTGREALTPPGGQHPRPPAPRPQPRPNPRPPAPQPRPPAPRPKPPVPNPNPPPRPHPRPRPIPVPVPYPWPYPSPYPPCSGGCRPNEYFVSPDGSRAVWIQGAADDAYLYDRTIGSFPPRWLEWEARWVDWYMDGPALGSFALERWDGLIDYFDPEGNRIPGPEVDAAQAPPAALLIKHEIGKGLDAKGSVFKTLNRGKVHW